MTGNLPKKPAPTASTPSAEGAAQIRAYSKVQVWIYAASGEILLLKTNSERGNFWQPVTGSVDEGESLEAAALREATEESGLPFSSKPRPLGFEFSFDSRWGRATETAFCLETPTAAKPILDPKEHDEYQWVSMDEAAKLLRFESNLKGLELLRGILPSL